MKANSFEAPLSISYTTGQLNSPPLALRSVNNSSLNLGPPLSASLRKAKKHPKKKRKPKPLKS